MVVCHCLAINDRALAAFAADPEATVEAITQACGAGGRCGGCRPTIAALLTTAQRSRAAACVSVGAAGPSMPSAIGSLA